MLKPEIISIVISALVALLTFTTFFQNRVANAERRLTIIEEENKQQNQALKECKQRLDNHDIQNQALIRLTVQMDELTKKIEKMDERIKKI
ncbi:holin [Streptococcus phage M102]|uniref:holin n=1 Tax=Streptococcus phage M102 TaxID=372457 RepID=UPI00015968F5|nr:holin [Streptococcus phage M102]YP_009216235.1 holin [Streptococcus phage M102AD]YP_009220168.1 holin [Streptococcus phage APCM01]ABD48920.1 unknown [Streptococcus phage M102AD]AKI28578.1 hypothetical protein APCM01_017 [Streptococcus phage APCM01]CAO77367.1 hypothetical protein [Streptococcus phage M102]